MRQLIALDRESIAGPCVDVPVPAAARPRLLIRGAVHPAVRDAQRRLNAFHALLVSGGEAGLAGAPLVEDCVFGSATQLVLIALQQIAFPGATAEHDGRLGPRTWAQLDRVAALPGPVPPVAPAEGLGAPDGVEEFEEQLPTIPRTPVSDLIRRLEAGGTSAAGSGDLPVLRRLDALQQMVGKAIRDRAAVTRAVDAFLDAAGKHPLSFAHQSLIGEAVGDAIAEKLVANKLTDEADRILAHFHSTAGDYGPAYRREMRTSFVAQGSGYFPDASTVEGGLLDRLGNRLQTLQDFRARNAKFVSVAMDTPPAGPPLGTRLSIDEFPGVVFRVVDTGDAFKGKGLSRIDICTADKKASLDPTINGLLHLNFAIPLFAPRARPQETTEDSVWESTADGDGGDSGEDDPPSDCPDRRLPGEITRSRGPGGILPVDVVEGPLRLTVHDFAIGSDVLPTGVTTAPGWQRVMSQLAGDPTSLVAVTGFADCVGSDAENASLRKRRELAIVAAMPPPVQQRVIRGSRVTTDFLDVNTTADGRARNRAVRLTFTLDNSKEPAVSIARNIDEFLYLVRVMERKLGLNKPGDAANSLSVLRQIYYGSADWSKFCNPLWDNVITRQPWPPATDPTTLLGPKLVTALKAITSVEGVYLGHVLTGLDAMMAPGNVVGLPTVITDSDVPNEAWATWAGDLGFAAGEWAADQYFNTLKGAGDVSEYMRRQAGDTNLTGNVDGFAIRAGLNGSTGQGQLRTVVRLTGRLSSVLLDYYRVTDGPLGRAREGRMRNFISAHGGSVAGGRLVNRAQLEAALRPHIKFIATLFRQKDLLGRSGQTGSPGLDPNRLTDSTTDAVTRRFVDWLLTRALAEPGP